MPILVTFSVAIIPVASVLWYSSLLYHFISWDKGK